MDFINALLGGARHHRLKTGQPFVTLSYAQSLDGCISARAGEALTLSGRQSLTLTHQLRAGHDAVLVGIGTVLSDNPRLNVRLVEGKNPQPIVVDSRLRLPLGCELLKQNSRVPWIVTREEPETKRRESIEALGGQVIPVPCNARGQVCLDAMLRQLAERGINSLMVEGGSRIITNFLLEGLVDYLVLTITPVFVGGLRAVSDLGRSDPAWFPRLRNAGHQWLGEDLILWGSLA